MQQKSDNNWRFLNPLGSLVPVAEDLLFGGIIDPVWKIFKKD
jgi:hypothetical protein